MDQAEWTNWPEPPNDAVPKDALHVTLSRSALFRQMSVQKGRDEAHREGQEEEPDLRLVELGMAQVEATLAIYFLLREKLDR